MPTVNLVSDSSDFNTANSGANATGFLSEDFPRSPPRLYVTAESDEFDALTLREWRDEGFRVEYVPMRDGGREYAARLERLSTVGLGVGETFGIVAYGDAAAFILEHYHLPQNNLHHKLALIIAYYPTRIPDPRAHYPSSIRVLVHLAGREVGVTRTNQVLGLQGKRRTVTRKIEKGLGTGGTLKIAWPTHTYDAEPGFAEHDLDEYRRVHAELAWSRSLDMAARAFRRDVNLERVLEENVQNKFFTRSVSKTLATYTTHKTPHVTHIPTLTGATGHSELQKFYSDFFIPCNPPSLKMRLLSRTLGSDRAIDELHVSFKHTQEMPWILPGIPPTKKRVEVLVVSIVCLRGGKLYHEHIYWDQASVLVQTDLLSPGNVPKKWKEKGVERLPVVGHESAERVLGGEDDDGEEGEAGNELIPDWEDEADEAEDESEEEEDENDYEVSDNENEKGKGKEVIQDKSVEGDVSKRPKQASLEAAEDEERGM